MKKFLIILSLFIISLAFVGCGDKTGEVDDEVGKITWTGLEDATVVRGDQVDLLAGITATDSIDGDITKNITIEDDNDFSSSLAGGYTVKYKVSNSTGVTESKTKNFTVKVAHNIANGDFAIPSYAWRLDIPGGTATVEYKDSQAKVNITKPGSSWWGIQLYQTNMIFKQGETYKLTLKASSPEGRSISAGFEDVDNGYSMLNPGFSSMQLTSTMQEYSCYYTAQADHANIKVVIYLGYQLESDKITSGSHTVVIDDVNIAKVTAAQNVTFSGVDEVNKFSGDVNFDPLAGVSAKDSSNNDVTSRIQVFGKVPNNVEVASTYYVSYRVTLTDGSFSFVNRKINIRLAKDFEYQAVNGKFDNGLTGWTQDVNQTNGDGAATFTDNGDGTVSIHVTSVSDAGWHIQLQQASSTFKQGETYVVRIVLKSNVARKVNVEVVDPGNGFAQIAPTLNAAEVGTDWTTYEIEFTADKNYTNAKIGLLLGNVDGMQPEDSIITVDEFQVYKYDAFNEEFNNTHEPWNLDHISGEVVNGEVVVTFVATGSEGNIVGNDPWNNQLYQSSGSRLIQGHKYKIEVNLKSSIARDIRFWIEDVNKGYAAIATGDNTKFALNADEYKVCTYEVEITEALATTNAKFVVMFGDSNAKGLAQVITIDYFRITDVTNN